MVNYMFFNIRIIHRGARPLREISRKDRMTFSENDRDFPSEMSPVEITLHFAFMKNNEPQKFGIIGFLVNLRECTFAFKVQKLIGVNFE